MSVHPLPNSPGAEPAAPRPVRVEDAPVLTGQARFIADIAPPNCLHAVFLRSPVASATMSRVDASAAAASPGVHLVLTGESIGIRDGLSVKPVFANMRPIVRAILSSGSVAAVGEAVALIVAETEFAARDAAERIEVEYAPEPALPNTHEARGGRPIFPDWPDNVAFERRWTHGDCAAAFAAAKHVVGTSLDMSRVAAVALEPRGAVADWDAAAKMLTVWLPTQTPHRARAELARLLGLSAENVRVINPCVGGAFGAKASIYPEDVLVAIAAMQLRRPVRWIATRNEDFVATSHGRGARFDAEAAVDARGRFLGLRANVVFPLGFWAPYSAVVPAWNTGRILPGPYRVANIDVLVSGVVTNTAPVGIFRGAGRPEAALIMERLMDEVARVVQRDPADVRRDNLIETAAFPYTTPTGEVLDSGNYECLLDRALDLSGYRQLRMEQARQSADRELVGVGICLYVEPCGRGWESARVSREPNGRILVACGTTAQGQGHQTTFAQIAAACLQVPMSQVDVIEGDTSLTPEGVGALASRSVAIGGSAVRAAAEQLRNKLWTSAAADTERVVASVVYTAPAEAWGSGCCIAVVGIDPDTGTLTVRRLFCVDDCGVVINPTLFNGQLVGGLAQGIGQALCERLVYDEEGQLLTGSLMDYAVPRADEMPPIDIHSIATATTANLLGAKGIGEAGCIAAPAAILNAAHDALRGSATTRLSLPLTSESIWRALQGAARPGEHA